jgi:hypothetical protein
MIALAVKGTPEAIGEHGLVDHQANLRQGVDANYGPQIGDALNVAFGTWLVQVPEQVSLVIRDNRPRQSAAIDRSTRVRLNKARLLDHGKTHGGLLPKINFLSGESLRRISAHDNRVTCQRRTIFSRQRVEQIKSVLSVDLQGRAA